MKNPRKRMPLADVPTHPWIQKFCKNDEAEDDPMDVDENTNIKS